ncbi:hypothetical protein [Catellatospora citrea]|uniref:Uncharacterized protein n=1 Tax=Catellatospora citrea TaxID=53366 RepID=A0A8J3NYF4_9ACTN|nr:hypothetical protein [Catellatospora citrea]RKE05648.1 hypothetical protein C8E86_0453 [Catellatospora citrea]GIF97003.1 hypothetical protein Cci01nite_20970 [Catellatospora citrea]
MRQKPHWVVRYPLGSVDAIRSMGTVTAPVLAGFALATLALLATSDEPPRFAGLAMVAFAVGAILFVFCLQFTTIALQYSATPTDRLAWLGDDATDPEVVARAHDVQRLDHRLQGRYMFRAKLTYDLGVLGHLIGLLALVAPVGLYSWRSVGFAVVAVGFALELVWIVGGWLGWRPRWLLPGYRDVGG